MADINDPTTPHDLTRNAPNDYDEGITEMALKLAPVNAFQDPKLAEWRKQALHLKPVAATRPTFQTVNDALATLIQRTVEINAEAGELRRRLTGEPGRLENPTGPSPGEDGGIFDFLAHQSLMLARLIAELEETVKACQDAVK